MKLFKLSLLFLVIMIAGCGSNSQTKTSEQLTSLFSEVNLDSFDANTRERIGVISDSLNK